jgi:hypothetical protein
VTCIQETAYVVGDGFDDDVIVAECSGRPSCGYQETLGHRVLFIDVAMASAAHMLHGRTTKEPV